MSFLKTNLDDHTVKTISNKIRDEFLDTIQDFDYTVFKYFKPEDQTTIKRINVDVRNNVLTLNRVFTFDYIHTMDEHVDPYWNRPQQYRQIKMNIDFRVRINSSTGKVTSVNIIMTHDGSTQSNDVFSLYVGDKKYLINSSFYDIEGFEGYVFQQSTVDKPTPFGLDYVLEIIQKLKV